MKAQVVVIGRRGSLVAAIAAKDPTGRVACLQYKTGLVLAPPTPGNIFPVPVEMFLHGIISRRHGDRQTPERQRPLRFLGRGGGSSGTHSMGN